MATDKKSLPHFQQLIAFNRQSQSCTVYVDMMAPRKTFATDRLVSQSPSVPFTPIEKKDLGS